jgi:hypothetical protein
MSLLTKIGRVARLALAPLALGALAACATSFNADVSRFQSQLPVPAGQTFAVVPDDPREQGGIEFRQYAADVAGHLAAIGYRPVENAQQADLVVHFNYGVDRGRERVESTGFRDPFYSGWYGYQPVIFRGRRGGARIGYVPGGAWGYGWYDPFFDGFGGDVYSYTVYTSGIGLRIDDNHTGRRLFEGKAEAVSTSNRLQYVVPNLIEAMFTGFPGNSGETVRISVAPEHQVAHPVR